MSLHVVQPPEEGLEIIRATIGRLMSQPATRTYALTEKIVGGDLAVAVPHPVYFVGAHHIAGGELLRAATLIGWRYILLDDEQPLLAAELSYAREGGRLEFSHTNDGPLVAGTVEGVRVAEGLEELREAEFELYLLEIHSLSVIALWFHAHQRDFFMPIPPTRRGLKPYALYTEEQLLTVCREAAARRLQIIGDRA